ncbi:MAG: 4Fe-4S binding protein [Oscillospiraceae bacterium]|nr:4Fe-4S binding protein [Oscillospiraceae bacterium]
MKERLKRLIPSKRKIMQLYFAVLFNANLKGFITGNIYQGNSKIMCAPGINCYSCPGAIAACPLGSLQGSFSADHSTIYYVGGILLLYALMFGRMICGWLCPFGLVQELMYKIKTPKMKKSPVTRALSYLKYAILVFFVLIVPIMYAFRDTPLPTFCKYICPAGTLEGGIGLLSNKVNASYFSMLGPLFTWKFLLMVSILVGCVFIFRLFCRFLCPLGALYGLFNKMSFFGVKVVQSKCTDCGLCVNHCKVDIKHVGDQECISCGSCVDVCPTKAIQWKGPKIKLKTNEVGPDKLKRRKTISRVISAVLLLGILGGTIAYYWMQPDQTNPNPGVITADRGNQVGDLCYNTDLPIVTANGVSEETLDPTATGTVTVINFWGTWCTPCVAELPYFEQIANEYGEDVTVIAVHSALSCETAPDYIGQYYPNSNLIFSQDSGEGFNGDYYTALGGRGTYPYTVVLDETGVITEVFVSSLTYDDLKTAVDDAM